MLQRNVGAEHDDAGAGLRRRRAALRRLDRRAGGQPQVARAAEIRQHQRAEMARPRHPAAAAARQLPMPPFKPKQLMPVPAPTAPTAKSSAARCRSPHRRAPRSPPSPGCRSGSRRCTPARPDSPCEVCRPMSGLAAIARRISALAQVPTAKVLVSRIGVSSTPSSFTCIRPMLLPNPFSTTAAATRLVAEQVAVMRQDRGDAGADVAFGSAWRGRPRTPGTSAMLLRSPGGSEPQARPRSRARIVSPIGAGDTGRCAPVRQAAAG